MSVTFSTETGPATGFAFTCGHENGVTAHRFGSYQDAEAFLVAELDAHGCTGHLAVCGDEYCAASRMFVSALEEDPAPQANVSNANARHLLGLLGYGAGAHQDSGLADSDTAEGFLGRVLVALAVNPEDRASRPPSPQTGAPSTAAAAPATAGTCSGSCAASPTSQPPAAGRSAGADPAHTHPSGGRPAAGALPATTTGRTP